MMMSEIVQTEQILEQICNLRNRKNGGKEPIRAQNRLTNGKKKEKIIGRKETNKRKKGDTIE